MAFGDLANEFFNSNTSTGTTSLAVTCSGTTVGNLLVANVTWGNFQDIDTPAGWTAIHDNWFGGGEATAYKTFWRIATGTDDVTFTRTEANYAGAIIQEFEGPFAVSQPDDDAEDRSNITTDVTSQGCGTATPVTAGGIAVAMMQATPSSDWALTQTTAPAGYSNLLEKQVGAASRPYYALASKVYTGTTAETPIFTTSDTGARAWGGVAVFEQGAVAGQTITLILDDGAATPNPLPGLSGLKWAWFDEVTPNLFNAPTDKGAAGSTDGSGELVLTLPNTTLTTGQTGWLEITDSTGSAAFVHKGLGRPVVVD